MLVIVEVGTWGEAQLPFSDLAVSEAASDMGKRKMGMDADSDHDTVITWGSHDHSN